MEDPHVIAEIVTPNVVRVGGVLFYKQSKSSSEETETIRCSRPLRGLKRERITVHVMECYACGRTYEHVNGDYERCPHCGAIYEDVSDDA